MRKFIFTAIIFCLFLSYPVKAASQFDVLINEIAWMGTVNSATDEWVELFNPTEKTINLDGWTIKSPDDPSTDSGQGKLKISLKGQIQGNGFYLLERTDDNSVPNVKSDLIYKGSLNNTGQNLILYDNNGQVIDQVSYMSGWSYGDNTTKQTMERIDSERWQTSKEAGGTPKAENSTGFVQIVNQNLSTDEALPKSEKSDNKVSVATASLQNSTESTELKEKEYNNPWLLFLISLATIVFLGILFLLIKFKIFKNVGT